MSIFIALLFSQIIFAEPIRAKALLEAKSGSEVQGVVSLTQKSDKLEITFSVDGLRPNSIHGFHVHEIGDCSAADGKSAGPHYMKVAEGNGTSIENPDHFAGDLPEIKADKSGHAKGKISSPEISLGKNHSILGRAFIIHESPDDIHAKSSRRIACGVIAMEK